MYAAIASRWCWGRTGIDRRPTNAFLPKAFPTSRVKRPRSPFASPQVLHSRTVWAIATSIRRIGFGARHMGDHGGTHGRFYLPRARQHVMVECEIGQTHLELEAWRKAKFSIRRAKILDQ
jgi:hypothetical protein